MRETFSEWECVPGTAPGIIESMDAAGFDPCTDNAPSRDADSVEAFASPGHGEGAVPCLDLRDLPAPEPLERAMAAAEALAPGAKLEVWTPMLPIPLLQLLEARGFSVCAELQQDGTARLLIARGND